MAAGSFYLSVHNVSCLLVLRYESVMIDESVHVVGGMDRCLCWFVMVIPLCERINARLYIHDPV